MENQRKIGKKKSFTQSKQDDTIVLLELIDLLKSVDSTSKQAIFNEKHMYGDNGKVIIY